MTEPYLDAGYDMPELLVDAAPTAGFDPSAVVIAAGRRPPGCCTTATSSTWATGAFEVLHLPGHSPGSIGLWEAGTGVLFSGDAVYDGPLLDELDGSDIDAYLAHHGPPPRRCPVTVVHGGHEPSFGRDRLVELCDAYLARRSP